VEGGGRRWRRFVKTRADVDRYNQIGRDRPCYLERQHRPQTAIPQPPAVDDDGREVERQRAGSIEGVV
jgi:hypothetical protein